MGNGIPILDTITKKCFVEQIHKTKFRIILTQGLNRQIRRMCEYLGYKVVKLVRVRIMNKKLQKKFQYLFQSLNRKKRRMYEYLGYKVIKHVRVRIMNIKKKKKKGKYRDLTSKELSELKKLISNSIKTS